MRERDPECQKVAKPGECSPEQIRKCHGDEGHPCAAEGECQGAPEPAECTAEQKAKCHGGGAQPSQ